MSVPLRFSKFVILGAGPTGLGAAWKLQELGCHDWLLLDAADEPGGLAASCVDGQGFTWDLGGHVQFSHYDYYDRVLDDVLGDEWLWHDRESWVWIRGRFVPYPFQNNIHRLGAVDRDSALGGLKKAAAVDRQSSPPPAHFRQWLAQTFGEGICELFLFPYNFKVWGYKPESMGVRWMGERVAVPDVARVEKNIREGKDDVSWGPNNRFRFPKKGGTGAIWRAVAARLPAAQLRYGQRVVQVDPAAHLLTLASGEQLRYESLITTIPLDQTGGIDHESPGGGESGGRDVDVQLCARPGLWSERSSSRAFEDQMLDVLSREQQPVLPRDGLLQLFPLECG